VASDALGNATFTWTGLDENQKRRGYARTRSASGTFGPIHVLPPPGVLNPRMAVNAEGTAVFVWACAGFSYAGNDEPSARSVAGVREAPRHEIAGRKTCCGRSYGKLNARALRFETR